MKTIKIAAFMFAAAALVSCSNKGSGTDSAKGSDEAPLEARTAEAKVMEGAAVTGEDAEYFSIAGPAGAETITITGTPDGNSGSITCKLDITVVKPVGEPVYDLGATTSYDIELLDATNNVLTTMSLSQADRETLEAELNKANPGTVTVNYSTSAWDDTYNKVFDCVKSVRLTNAEVRTEAEWNASGSDSSDEGSGDVEGDDEDNGGEGDESVSASSSSSNEWDSLLDDYDSYVSKMTSCISKMSGNDPTAAMEYAQAQMEAASLLDKLSRAKSDMTAAQMARFNKIQAKYVKAMQQAR